MQHPCDDRVARCDVFAGDEENLQSRAAARLGLKLFMEMTSELGIDDQEKGASAATRKNSDVNLGRIRLSSES